MITLQLVDPRFYHLDTALCRARRRATSPTCPEAFSPGQPGGAAPAVPGRGLATAADAAVLGLNAVSDGRHVVLPRAGHRPRRRSCASAATRPIAVDLSELRKAGGGLKCCTLELAGDEQ